MGGRAKDGASRVVGFCFPLFERRGGRGPKERAQSEGQEQLKVSWAWPPQAKTGSNKAEPLPPRNGWLRMAVLGDQSTNSEGVFLCTSVRRDE